MLSAFSISKACFLGNPLQNMSHQISYVILFPRGPVYIFSLSPESRYLFNTSRRTRKFLRGYRSCTTAPAIPFVYFAQIPFIAYKNPPEVPLPLSHFESTSRNKLRTLEVLFYELGAT